MTSFQELNARLVSENAAKAWLPNAQKSGLYLSVGDIQGSKGQSLKVCLRSGRWKDYATGESGGDLISLYAAIHSLSQSEAKRELEGKNHSRVFGIPKAPKVTKDDSARNLLYAAKIWYSSSSAQGTLVEAYLQSRNIRIPPPENLRFNPNLCHSPSKEELPAMVSAVRHGISGNLMGIHRTWLKRDGSGKADIKFNKMMLGPVDGGAVQLSSVAPEMIVAEGIETALSVMQATNVPTWAALSTSGLEGLILSPVAQKITIACDNDSNNAGLNAAEYAADKWTKEGREVSLAIPPLNKDFNDLLIGME